MLTLPTEINNEKDKQSNSPILLIEFPDLSYYIATKTYTLDTTTYDGIVAKSTNISISHSIPNILMGYGSVSSVVVNVLEWKNKIEPNIFSTGGDKTDTPVLVRLKYDTSSTASSDSVVLFKGKLASYSVTRDRVTFTIKAAIPALDTKLPKTSFGDAKMPLQYGDFQWDTDPRWWGDITKHYAICPLAYYDDVSGNFRYNISSHLMDTLPNPNDIGGSTSQLNNAHLFFEFDGEYCHATLNTAPTFTNGSSGAYMEGNYNTGAYRQLAMYKPPKTGNANAIDGKQSTYITLSAFSSYSFSNFGFNKITHAKVDTSYTNPAAALIYVKYYDPGSDAEVKISDGTNTVTYSIGSAGWQTYAFPSAANSFDAIEKYTITLTDLNDGYIEVSNILVRVRIRFPSSPPDVVYLRCKGRQYSGTWGGRKTSGVLIENPVDALESIMRDELGYVDADFDLGRLDVVSSDLNTAGVKAAFSVYEEITARRLIQQFLEAFGLILFYSEDKWKLQMTYKTSLKFTVSGTDTPADGDIYTDTTNITTGKFDKNPIRKQSFSIDRTSERIKYDKIQVNYVEYDGGFMQTYTTGAGDKIYEIDNKFIRDRGSLNSLMNKYKNLLLTQRFIAKFSTFWNAIAVEEGDIINIQHRELTDNVVVDTVTSQKWMVVSLKKSWRPNVVEVKAVELA